MQADEFDQQGGTFTLDGDLTLNGTGYYGGYSDGVLTLDGIDTIAGTLDGFGLIFNGGSLYVPATSRIVLANDDSEELEPLAPIAGGNYTIDGTIGGDGGYVALSGQGQINGSVYSGIFEAGGGPLTVAATGSLDFTDGSISGSFTLNGTMEGDFLGFGSGIEEINSKANISEDVDIDGGTVTVSGPDANMTIGDYLTIGEDLGGDGSASGSLLVPLHSGFDRLTVSRLQFG
jgi:hypothetical protein